MSAHSHVSSPARGGTARVDGRAASLRTLTCLLLVALFSGSTTLARARPPRHVSLHFTRGEHAESCIDPVSLARKVEAYTGPVLVAPSSAEAAVEVHVVPAKRGFRARIQLSTQGQTPHGERILEHAAPDCRSFDDALAFVIATTIDPDLVLEKVSALFDPRATPGKETLLAELPALPVPRSELASPTKPPAKKAVLPPPATDAKAVWVRLLAVGLLVSGELPEPAVGPSLAARWRARRWLELAVSARAAVAVRAYQVEEDSGERVGSVRTSLFAGALLACPRWPLGARFAVAACLGPELELLRAAGHDFDLSKTVVHASVRALVRPELTTELRGPYSLGLAGFVTFGKGESLVYQVGEETEDVVTGAPAALGGELTVRRTF